MSTASSPYYFRRRIGRAASPPTWACYEQIPHDDDDCTDSDSCSEDEEDYSRAVQGGHDYSSDPEDGDGTVTKHEIRHDDLNMDIDEEGDGGATNKAVDSQKDFKGKQRAIEPEPEKIRSQQRQKKQRPPVYTLRPILTIQKSQGFVWNQDLFVPPYIKDRYVASTSPPNSKGFISTSLSSTNSGLTDYEVEVVEIRVNEGDLSHIMP